MSKVCITIPAECKSCYKLCIEYCPTGINIQAGLVDGDVYFLFAVDHFGNVWRDEVTINPDGSFDIDLANYPSGFFTSTSGAVNIFLSENEDGSNPIDITFESGTYNCILITTEPQVNFVDPDITVFNPGNSGCGVVPSFQVQWGDIGGDILNQTDLIDYIATHGGGGGLTCEDLPDCQTIIDIQNEFDNYVPYLGATQDVDLGVYKMTVDAVEFSLNPTNAAAAGQIVYNGATGALNYLLNNSNVASQIGETLHAYVHNAEGVQINKGEAVYLYQATGNKASVKLAYNTGDATSAKTFGLAAENIGAGQNGMVITQGVLDGINTGMYNAGDTLYLGATAGTLTAVKPYAPNHLVYIGVVEKANNGNGQIYVRVQNGYELTEIHDVDLISVAPVNNDILTYVTGSPNLWKPRSIATILGYTPLANNAWVDYSATSTIVGWTTFTFKQLKYKIVGNMMFVNYAIYGTSNANTTSFTLPSNAIVQTENPNRSQNNGVWYHGFGIILAASNVVTFNYWQLTTSYTPTWTASGSKVITGTLFFEI